MKFLNLRFLIMAAGLLLLVLHLTDNITNGVKFLIAGVTRLLADDQGAALDHGDDLSSKTSHLRLQPTTSFFQNPCYEIPLPSQEEFYRYLNTVTLPCRNKTMFGGIMIRNELDGDKFVCMDSPPYGLSRRDCTVFSFGINNEWSFDDAVDRQGCKIYAFDPTMGKPSHDRSPNIRFYDIGVSGEDGTINISNKSCQVLTYKSIVQLTSTENKTIDYIKIDVEGAERPFFDEAFKNSPHLLQKAKQIGAEIHVHGSNRYKLLEANWRLFQNFECLGFRLMHMNLNRPNTFTVNGANFSCCYELVWLMDAPLVSIES